MFLKKCNNSDMAENVNMQNYKLKISYDGTRYYGWERQPNKNTIQGKIEAVLSRMCDTDIEIIALADVFGISCDELLR